MEALCQLDLRHRQVLVEVYYRGRSITEAAARLGVPPETVKERTYYALRRLRLLLEEGDSDARLANDGALPDGGRSSHGGVFSDGAATLRGDVSVFDGGEA